MNSAADSNSQPDQPRSDDVSVVVRWQANETIINSVFNWSRTIISDVLNWSRDESIENPSHDEGSFVRNVLTNGTVNCTQEDDVSSILTPFSSENRNWHDESRDKPHREVMIRLLVNYFKENQNASPFWQGRVNEVSALLEALLYRGAQSFATYSDKHSLDMRIPFFLSQLFLFENGLPKKLRELKHRLLDSKICIVCEKVSDKDVVIGDGNENVVLKDPVSACYDDYEAASQRKDRKEQSNIIANTMKRITDNGGRFMRKRKFEGYVQINNEEARDQVSSRFRYNRRKRKRST